MKIVHRLSIGFTILLCLFGAYGLFTLDQMGRLADLTDNLYNYPHAVSRTVLQAENHILSINRSIRHLITTDDRKQVDVLISDVREYQGQVYENFEAIKTKYQGEQRVLLDAYSAFADWEPIVNQIIDLKTSGRDREAEQIFESANATTVQRLEGHMRLLANFTEARAAEFIVHAHRTRDASRGATLSLLFLMIVIAAGLSYWLAQSVRRPLRTLNDMAWRIAGGELDVRVEVHSKDEFRQLADSFNEMVAALRDALDEVQQKNDVAEASAREANEVKAEVLDQQEYLERKVKAMLAEMERFARGELSVQLEVERDDEIGRLYEGFNATVANVRSMLMQVEQAVAAAVGATAQISTATEALASSAREQSAQTDDVAAAVEEITRTIIENARNAAGTADAAELSREQARGGGAIVQQTVEKIRHIADVVAESSRTIEDLGASSREIGQIVRVIREIADQTNLLALNAAIEAARAGEHGRGFAVVADEVRKLAERTTQATKQIAGVIETIQLEVERAIQTIHTGRREVTEGIDMADRAGDALSDIVRRTEEVGGLIAQIAAATEEQSATSEEISRTIENISTVTSESAEGITQIAQASDDLAHLMNDLQSRVSRFHLDAGEPGVS
ncbi:MAG: methyl-accepting chemotaxis protein, partial [Rhodothermales bacterium]